AGLGIHFLKHLSRTQLLLHIVDMQPYDGSDPVEEANTIVNELGNFSPELADKPRWLVLNKSDLMDEEELKSKQDDIIQRLNWEGPVYTISAISKKGTETLAFDIMQQLELDKELEQEQQPSTEQSETEENTEASNDYSPIDKPKKR
ncbi:MAG: GTPase ObgE, partial [Proteobacteria bacterium]|nr:GTPase ObgE [Pseudomonadota bacterium]